MPVDLLAALPMLLPRAVAWAEAQSREGAESGIQLSGTLEKVARTVGVRRPGLIRISLVQELPLPDDVELRTAALQAGLLGPEMDGLTLGYSVFVCHAKDSTRLLSHEFRHVYQYEENGLVGGFLPMYLRQVVQFGYMNAPIRSRCPRTRTGLMIRSAHRSWIGDDNLACVSKQEPIAFAVGFGNG